MRRKKGRFLTFLFSLMPGAGHMYMGFMKTGISLMSVFFFIIFLSSWLNIGPLLFIIPVLWFFSFFDCINKFHSSDEEFIQFGDNYLFSIDTLLENGGNIFKKQGLYVGILLVIFGLLLVWNNVMSYLRRFLPQEVFNFILHLTRDLPQLVIGIIIIIIGIRLIIVKKKESDGNV